MRSLFLLLAFACVAWAEDRVRPAYVHEKVDESNEPFYSAFNIPFVNDYATHLAYDMAIAVNATVTVATAILTRIPGHRFVAKYIKASHQNDPGRTVVEVSLFVFMLAYILRQRRRNKSTGSVSKLTQNFHGLLMHSQEVEDLIDEWKPDPLVPDVFSPTQEMDLDQSITIIGASGPRMTIRLTDVHGKDRSIDGIQGNQLDVITASSYNFLGYLNNQDLREEAVKTLRSYGVGSCGPPGFYGTLDVHMALEKEIAQFLGMEQAIIYSQGFSTISSAIPAFAKRGDLLIVDDAVNFSIQKGVQISRSTVKLFRHNDMEHLESLLEDIHAEDERLGRRITKRFIITEAVFSNSGDIAPLPDLIRMKHKYKWRLILEESCSLGVLGKTGRGLTEHYGIDSNEVDMIAASMGNVLGSGGGFVAGSRPIVDHQRLSGQAYCFSASLPAVLAVTATETLHKMASDNGVRVNQLRQNTRAVRDIFSKAAGIVASGNEASALMHLRFVDRKQYFRSRDEEESALQMVCNEALKEGVLISRAKFVTAQETRLPQPSIRFVATSALTQGESEKVANVVKSSFEKILASLPKK